MNPIEINIDYKYPKIEQIELVQGDVKPFEIILTDNYEEVNLQGSSVAINMLKADDTFIIQTTGFVVDKNKIKFTNPKDFTRESGIAKMQVIIKDSSYENYTWEIKAKIIPAVISEDSIPSENIIPAVEELDNSIQLAIETKDILDEWVKNNQEVINLQERVNDLETKVTKNTTDISNANKNISDINTEITQIKKNATDLSSKVTQQGESLSSIISDISTIQEFNRKFASGGTASKGWMEMPLADGRIWVKEFGRYSAANGGGVRLDKIRNVMSYNGSASSTVGRTFSIVLYDEGGNVLRFYHDYGGTIYCNWVAEGFK